MTINAKCLGQGVVPYWHFMEELNKITKAL
jgi:hypothetical protein